MSEHNLTLLKPVVLANDEHVDEHDDYHNDDEQTSVKQVYSLEKDDFENIVINQPDVQANLTDSQESHIECAQRPRPLEISVSSRQLVQVSTDNVDNVYNDIVQSSSVTDKLVDLYRDLPKELFLSQILSDYHSDENELYSLRNKLFNELKDLEEFPFASTSELKKRKHTRAGEGVAMKLCTDIYTLTSVIDGGPFEDLRDLLSSSKLASQNQSICGDSGLNVGSQKEDKDKTNGNDAELSLLRGMVVGVQADILQLKEANRCIREEFTKDLKLVKDEIKSTKEELKSVLDSSKRNSNFIGEMQLSFDRIINEKSNGVANLRSDVKQIRADLKISDDTNALEIMIIKDKLADMNKLDKRVSKMENKIKNVKSAVDGSTKSAGNSDTCEINIHESDSSNRIERSFTAVKFPTNDIENQLMGSNCKTTSDIDIGCAGLQRSTALVRSPSTGHISRLPLNGIENKTVIHENRSNQLVRPPNPPPPPSNGDLINFSPNITGAVKENNTLAGNKPSLQQIKDLNQEILPHEFSASKNTHDSGLLQSDTTHDKSIGPRGNSHSVPVMMGSLQNLSSSNGTLNNVNVGTNQINAISDASSSYDYGPYGSPGIMGVPGLMSAGTVLTPLGTIVTPEGTVVNGGQIGNNPYMYQCSTENRYTVLQDKSYSDVINTNSTAKTASDVNNGQIPVIRSNRSDKRSAPRRERYNPRSHPEPAQYVNDDRGGIIKDTPNVGDSANSTCLVSNARGSIPVIMSNRPDKRLASRRDRYNPRSHPEPAQYDNDDSDDDFETHIRRRSRRFYIGGFKPSISLEKLQHYVERKGVTVTWISIRRYEKQNKAVIRLNVDAQQASAVLEAGFWPRGITCRQWLTKNQLKNRVSNSDRNGYFDRESNINDDQAMNIRRYGDEDSAQYSIS